MISNQRYQRLSKHSVGGLKIAGRRTINPGLTSDEVFEDEPSFGQLRIKFGESDTAGDAVYSYSIRDTVLGVEFEAYCGNSGPCYGGDPLDCFMDYNAEDYRLKPIVLQSLTEFEEWLNQKEK